MKINACFLLVKKEVRTSQKLYSSNPVNGNNQLSLHLLIDILLFESLIIMSSYLLQTRDYILHTALLSIVATNMLFLLHLVAVVAVVNPKKCCTIISSLLFFACLRLQAGIIANNK
jgi:hypothetical protein